jgi:hypothetical protein
MPVTTALDVRYSDPSATAESWDDAIAILESAPIFWLTTVRPDGRPHVTPLIAVWHDDALHICTGAEEVKARNLAANDACVLTTGSNAYETGLDIVVEGHAVRVTQAGTLERLAAAYLAKYGPDWAFDVDGDAFEHGGHRALDYRIALDVAFGFRRGASASQTRWTF